MRDRLTFDGELRILSGRDIPRVYPQRMSSQLSLFISLLTYIESLAAPSEPRSGVNNRDRYPTRPRWYSYNFCACSITRCVDSEEAWPRKCFLLGFLCDGFSWRAYRDKEDGGKDGKVQRGLHMGLDEVRHDGVRVRHGQDRAHQEQESGSHESHRTTRHHWLHDRVRLVAIVVLCRCCCGSHVTRRSSQSLLTSSSGKSFVHAYKKYTFAVSVSRCYT